MAGLCLVTKRIIKYVDGDETLLDQIRPLWEALNRHHLALSMIFKQYYLDMTFQKRKTDLIKKAALGEMRVDIAVDDVSGQNIGYCISSLTEEKIGEVQSIYVSEPYRSLGIGDALMKKALGWLDEKGAVEKFVEVGAGNEQTLGFYSRYDFLPRKTMLKQVQKV